MVNRESSRPASAEQRLKEFSIELPTPPEPFGIYAEAVQTGNLLFLTGMLPTVGREAKFVGRVGGDCRGRNRRCTRSSRFLKSRGPSCSGAQPAVNSEFLNKEKKGI